MRDWKLLKVVIDGEYLEIEGANVWEGEWTALYEPNLEVPHPSYSNQRHILLPYYLEAGN